jgi:hypothetical protein
VNKSNASRKRRHADRKRNSGAVEWYDFNIHHPDGTLAQYIAQEHQKIHDAMVKEEQGRNDRRA